jgi:hypothetical protein
MRLSGRGMQIAIGLGNYYEKAPKPDDFGKMMKRWEAWVAVLPDNRSRRDTT